MKKVINKDNKKNILLNIIVIIFLLFYGFIVIAPFFDLPMVRVFKNFTGDLIHYILRLIVIIFTIVYATKCKKSFFKIIYSFIAIILIPLFIIRLFTDSVMHDEATLQKIDISKSETLESIYYPDEPGLIEIVYKKELIGTIYCQKVIYSISYDDEKLENISIPLEKYYDEIKDKKFGLCGLNLKHISTNYKNDDSDYDVKNAKTIILDDSIEVSGKKLDEKVRLVVYPTKNNNCKDEIRLYSQYGNSNVYFVCIGEIEIIPHPNISHIETVKDNSKSYIEYITRQMNVKEKYRDGGSIMYERDNLRVLKCNTIDGNKDVYFGTKELEYKNNFCKN